jgi:hypothetical protein
VNVAKTLTIATLYEIPLNSFTQIDLDLYITILYHKIGYNFVINGQFSI